MPIRKLLEGLNFQPENLSEIIKAFDDLVGELALSSEGAKSEAAAS